MSSHLSKYAAALCLLGLVACAKKIQVARTSVRSAGVIAASADWIKDKGNKYDMVFRLTNEDSSPIVIMTDDVKCGRGGAGGRHAHEPFTRSNVAIQFAAAESKSWVVVCEGGGSGDFEIFIGNVYRLDAQSSTQRGELLARSLTFRVAADGSVKEGEGAPAWAANLPSSSSPESDGPKTFVKNLFTTKSGTGVEGGSNPQGSSNQGSSNQGSSNQGSSNQGSSNQTQPAVKPEEPRKRSAVVASPSWVIAVLDVADNNAGRSNAIDKDLVRSLSDQIRIFVAERGIRTVDRSAQEKALKEQIKEMKSDSYKSCYDDACQVELGKALAASHILRSQITRFGTKCVLNAELIDLKAEVAITAASARGDCGDEGFLRMSEEVAQTVTGR